ncbi:MAG: formate transporter FocA [Lacipirellulaceae bacterium]
MPVSKTNNQTQDIHIDAFLPVEMAKRAEQIGVQKAALPASKMFVLAVLAGAFIALGAIFATVVTTQTAQTLSFGVTRLLGGVAFCLGLVLVVVAGAELFTGNNLVVMALASGKLTVTRLLWSWTIVYAGNFTGAVLTALIMLFTRQYNQAHGGIGLNVLSIAANKCSYSFLQAFSLGILCNALVCLAVWLCYSARSTTDKILAILFPITAFVAAGFEHSVANMYFVPAGLFVKSFAEEHFWEIVDKTSTEFVGLNWENFLVANLLPVTLGNIVGGSLMVGLVYWFVYLRGQDEG